MGKGRADRSACVETRGRGTPCGTRPDGGRGEHNLFAFLRNGSVPPVVSVFKRNLRSLHS